MSEKLVKKCKDYNNNHAAQKMSKAVLKRFRQYVAAGEPLSIETEAKAWAKTNNTYSGHMKYKNTGGSKFMKKELQNQLKEISQGLLSLSSSDRKSLRKEIAKKAS